MGTQVTLTRTNLYDLVWAEPLSALAARYHLSEYALRKICIDLSIPLPRAGHWKRVEAGDAGPIPPLPPMNGQSQSVTLSAPAAKKKPILLPSRPLDPLLVAVKQTLTRKENAYLRNGLRRSDSQQLDIRIVPANIDRALLPLHGARADGPPGFPTHLRMGSARSARRKGPLRPGSNKSGKTENKPNSPASRPCSRK